MTRPDAGRPAVAVIGAGGAGTSLAASLGACGWPASLLRRADLATAPALDGGPVIVLAVRDAQIQPLAESLAGRGRWDGRVAIHLSGSQPSSLLAALARAGASVASLHPLVSLGPGPDGRPRTIPEGTPFFAEGDALALSVARDLALAVGGTFHPIPTPAKDRYHAAATVAGNLVAILHAAGARTLGSLGVDEPQRALLPLARASVDAVAQHAGLGGLTGPLVRGDVETLRANIEALRGEGAALRRAHAAVSLLGLELLDGDGTMPDRRDEMVQLLRAVLMETAVR